MTSATKADASANGGIGPDDRVAVFDLTSYPPKVVQSLNAGAGATQVRVSPDGTLALIASAWRERSRSFRSTTSGWRPPARSIPAMNSLPTAMVLVSDRHALLTHGGNNMVNVLHIDRTTVTIDPRPITAGIAPYTTDINAAHTLAAVANMGRGDRDARGGDGQGMGRGDCVLS